MVERQRITQPQGPEQEEGNGGVFLSWRGRKRAKILVPLPRLLETLEEEGDPTEEDPGNLIIEGDNKQAMSSLRYLFADQVDVVLIDPPYNTGKEDFRYSDKRYEDPDAAETSGAYVSGTEKGRHTKWLNEMAPTLRLIHDLMSPSGVIFVHINDRELPRLLMLMEEVFTEENHLGTLIWKSATDNNPSQIVVEHEYILCYAKNRELLPSPWRGQMSATKEAMVEEFRRLQAECGSDLPKLQKRWAAFMTGHKEEMPRGLVKMVETSLFSPFEPDTDLGNPHPGGYLYEVMHPNGKPAKLPMRGWRYPEETMKRLLAEDLIAFGRAETKIPRKKKRLLDDLAGKLPSIITEFTTQMASEEIARLFPENSDAFPYPKPAALEEYLLSFVANKSALVLDCFAGSGTTGHAVMRLNKRDGGHRRFILIERGEPGDAYATSLTAERLRRARTVEKLPGGFTFQRVGPRIDQEGLLNMERSLVAEAVLMADTSGRGGGIKPVKGELVIGRNRRREALCLSAGIHDDKAVTGAELRAMLEEAERLGLKTPMRVYGVSCEVYEDELFAFFQLPDEIIRNLYSGRGMTR